MADRFPPPWTVHSNHACYWVEDASGQRIAYCYFKTNESIGSGTINITRDGARRIAANIAKLPELIQRMRSGGGD